MMVATPAARVQFRTDLCRRLERNGTAIKHKMKNKGRKITADTDDELQRPGGSNVVNLMAALKESLQGRSSQGLQAQAQFRQNLEAAIEQLGRLAEGRIVPHNADLAGIFRSIRRRLQALLRAQFQTSGRLGQTHREHGDVVQATLRGDRDGAEQAIRRHISIVQMALHDLGPTLSVVVSA